MFPLVQLPKKFKGRRQLNVQRLCTKFPLIQLPKKFKGDFTSRCPAYAGFPLVQLPKKFKDQLTKKPFLFRTGEFPLVQLPKKFKEYLFFDQDENYAKFPLVQLPKKFKAAQQALDNGFVNFRFH